MSLIFLVVASPADARTSENDAVYRVVRVVAEAQDAKDYDSLLRSTWPDGSFTLTGNPSRSWRNFVFGGMGVWNKTSLSNPVITIRGERASVTVREHSRSFYDTPGGPDGLLREDSGTAFVGRDRVELERRHGEWRVLNWHRSGRRVGTDAAWHRRHP